MQEVADVYETIRLQNAPLPATVWNRLATFVGAQ
jgi:hypothetical protein